MNAQITPANVTMSSLELVEYINSQREEGEAELRHDNFMAKVPKVLGEEDALKFKGIYQDAYGREKPCYNFPKREACLMAMSYSYELQAKVFDRMTALEEQLKLGSTAKGRAQPALPSVIQPTKEFKALFSVARLIGLDKNAAAISANQAAAKLTGTNVLALLGQQHLEAENQASLYFTPTELGERIGVSGRKFNMLLAEVGLQAKKGEHWAPLAAAEGFCRILDTGKRHGDGTMVQQVKWAENVLSLIEKSAA
jgi:hypothetical protein